MKTTFIERCVYFFDLKAYEKRLNAQSDTQMNYQRGRIERLEEMLVNLRSGNADPIQLAEIDNEVYAIKKRKEEKKRLEELIIKSL